MTKRLNGKRALITAAGQGIGKATALAMAAEGAHVFATDVNTKTLKELSDEATNVGTLEVFELDVLSKNSVEKGIMQSKPDILFNCAGFVHNGTILEASAQEWDNAWDLNVSSMFRTIRAALPGMIERGSGSIINMSSQLGHVGMAGRNVYNMTKFGIEGLTKGMGVELAKNNIRVNTVAPTFVATPMVKRFFKNKEFKKAASDQAPPCFSKLDIHCSKSFAFVINPSLMAVSIPCEYAKEPTGKDDENN